MLALFVAFVFVPIVRVYDFELNAERSWKQAQCVINEKDIFDGDSKIRFHVTVYPKPRRNGHSLSPYNTTAERYPSYTQHKAAYLRGERKMSEQAVQNLKKKYYLGETYKCFYDPKHITDVSLREGGGAWIGMRFGLCSWFLFVVGVFLCFGGSTLCSEELDSRTEEKRQREAERAARRRGIQAELTRARLRSEQSPNTSGALTAIPSHYLLDSLNGGQVQYYLCLLVVLLFMPDA